MKCRRCRQENPPNAKFCSRCATPLARTCAYCGTPLAPEAKFCVECARPVGTPPSARQRFDSPESYTPLHLAERILSSKSSLEGERKQVTVLFADLKSSMELLADRDPEEARQLLDPVLERMMAAVHRYEGTVNQVMGDGIMALFGAPLAYEDHGVRACYAALAIQRSIRRYSRDVRRTHGIEVQVRVGLNSGEVVVRAIGSDLHMDYTAVGQTTHLAARMEQLAPPGSTRLTAETFRLAEGFIAVESLGAVAVKGLEAPLDVYELTGVGPVQRRLDLALTRGLTPFVGRGAEMERLCEALDRAAKGQGQMVAVVGEPGVGKSRLVRELTHSHRTHEWRVLQSGARSYGKATPYLAVIELLEGYFGIREHDDHREIRDKVIGRLLGLDRALEVCLSAFFSLLDVPVEDPRWLELDPIQRRRQTLDSIQRLLLRESQVQPLVVVVEDLHWLDAASQATLDRLIEGLPTARLLLLVNYRPEYEHSRDGTTGYTQLRLDPLEAAGSDELLADLLGSDPSVLPLKRLLVERTEGNPLFLEESVRALVDSGVLSGSAGAWRLSTPVDDIQIPATVQAILAARIDRLSSEDKNFLQAASVIGKDVPFELLQAVWDVPEGTLRGSLSRLQAVEFLCEKSVFPEIYTFKHALTHDVAYEGLLRGRRRELHGRILATMEARSATGSTKHVDRLAHHALNGEFWAKAVAYLRQAIASAMAQSAHREAAVYVDQALSALAHLPASRERLEQAVDFRFALRGALWPLGRLDRILEALGEAEVMAEELGDPRRRALCALHLCSSFYGAAEHDLAVAAGERALEPSATLGAIDLRVLALSSLGQAYVARTDYRRAAEVLTPTLKLLEGPLGQDRFDQLSLPGVLARLSLVRALVELGNFGEAVERGDEALRIADEVDHSTSRVLAHFARGLPPLRRGDAAGAIAFLEPSVHQCEESGWPLFRHWLAPALGAAYTLAGRVSEALGVLERVLAEDEAVNAMSQNTLTITYLAEALLAAGEVAEAEERAARALALARDRCERGYEAWAHRLLGEIGARQHDFVTSELAFSEALTLADELGMRPLAAHCHLGLARLASHGGDLPQAEEQLGRATSLYREMDMRFWLGQAESAPEASGPASGVTG